MWRLCPLLIEISTSCFWRKSAVYILRFYTFLATYLCSEVSQGGCTILNSALTDGISILPTIYVANIASQTLTSWYGSSRLVTWCDLVVSGLSPQSISAIARLRKVSSLGHKPKFCVSWVTKQKFTRSRFSKIALVQKLKVTKVTERATSSILKLECFAWLIVDFNITEQGWRSGESTRLPLRWPGFNSQGRCLIWVEFVQCWCFSAPKGFKACPPHSPHDFAAPLPKKLCSR